MPGLKYFLAIFLLILRNAGMVPSVDLRKMQQFLAASLVNMPAKHVKSKILDYDYCNEIA
ncbi:hypothetical protein GCM10011450_27010 [Advenella faeciporci]|uniref:Uncharacterized protein n=1 Tax=Advenella faeciporci TaxID=797535 RepID=A0A918JQZ1_9BURK|nr:hypothetical protein GCM10011450_27010 [Advenella faeciporci]